MRCDMDEHEVQKCNVGLNCDRHVVDALLRSASGRAHHPRPEILVVDSFRQLFFCGDAPLAHFFFVAGGFGIFFVFFEQTLKSVIDKTFVRVRVTPASGWTSASSTWSVQASTWSWPYEQLSQQLQSSVCKKSTDT